MTPRLVVATRNKGKLVEMRRILEPAVPDVVVLGLDDLVPFDEPDETEPSFEGNALIKARVTADVTGLPSLADDSGICVDALNGMPGVRSARWAGPAKDDKANNALLLAQLDDVPAGDRGAEFRCAVALVQPVDGGGPPTEVVEIGVMRGTVLREPQGEGGFGYDPLFVASGQKVSNGVLDAAAKDAISHRGKALRAIVPALIDALSQ
ncbi:MAG: non-canonical purine NTP pyrophosphatase [Nocardioidaceae bacterium]